MSNIKKAIKRDGRIEPIDSEKMNKVVQWAAEGLEGVSASQVLMKAHIQLSDETPTREIHKMLVKSAADLISEEAPNYAYLAARLAFFDIRKAAYGDYQPPHIYDHVVKMVGEGRYDKHLLEDFSKEDFDKMEEYIHHTRDLNYAYSAAKQMEGKYLVQNRVTGEIFESPQMLNMLVSACFFANYPKGVRMGYIKRFYDAVSLFKISLPTPIMAGVRTPTRQFSSCVLIESDDSLDSINAVASAIVKYVSQRAGIGVNAGKIRALGSEIRNGEAFHTGCIPFYKHFQTAVKSCSQGGVRGGAATLYYPFWHREFESLIVLKNNRGVEENRVRHLDYGVQLNKLAYERLIKKGHITLFSPSDVPGLYEAFFADQKEFQRLYEMYEQDESIKKTQLTALEIFGQLASERASTGRIYIQNVDHTNTHGAFLEDVAPIRMSNLCVEIALPTKPIKEVNDPKGEVALCTLSAFNLGVIKSLDELEDLANLLVRALDSLLDYQDYPILPAKIATMNRRPLGVGVVNFANYLAKNGVRYSDGSANNLTHRTFEAIQYYLLKASNELAKERGACPAFNETKYSKGILPIDTYKKAIDELTDEPLHFQWGILREDIVEYGLRNSTLTALMPCETSSQITNSTNGIEPPRGYVSIKASKDGVMKQVVPDYQELKDAYELLWDIPSNAGYLQLVGIMQKFVDQAISANTNYDPKRFPGEKVPMKQILQDLTTAYKFGLKTLYYHNTRDGATDDHDDGGCESGACKL